MKRRHITNPLFSLAEIYEKIKRNNSPFHLAHCPSSKNTDSGWNVVYSTNFEASGPAGGAKISQNVEYFRRVASIVMATDLLHLIDQTTNFDRITTSKCRITYVVGVYIFQVNIGKGKLKLASDRQDN